MVFKIPVTTNEENGTLSPLITSKPLKMEEEKKHLNVYIRQAIIYHPSLMVGTGEISF